MNDESSAGELLPRPVPREGYAGDVDARQAWKILSVDSKSVLVDVRTRAEWEYVGIPVLDELGKQTVFAEWQTYPSKALNPSFRDEIDALGVDRDAPLLFICRSGVRSAAAAKAMTEVGYTACYNVSGGFEGPHDDGKHRGSVDGWKVLGLAWIQG